MVDIIRLAMHSDIENILPLVKSFYDESLKCYGFNFSEEVLRGIMKEHCDNQSALIMVENEKIIGVIAGKFVQFPTSDFKIFQEVIWYVFPEYRKNGLRLFHETERYCKSIGIQVLIMGNMANLNNDKMEKFYKSQSYSMMEVQWIKIL